MSFLDLFSGHATLYALARPQYPAELFDWIASQAPARESAWDCGTGNGQAAISLARHFNQVYATDPSEEQISQARRTSNVTYQVEPAEHTSLLMRSMDAICVAQALPPSDLRTMEFPAIGGLCLELVRHAPVHR